MRKILSLAVFFLLTQKSEAGIDVVYGKDNRQDVYEVRNVLHKRLARSSAAMIHLSQLHKTSSNLYALLGTNSLGRILDLCPSEAFAYQQAAADCSGFLVAPDIIVTAGHCYMGQSSIQTSCESYAWVFDYEMKSPHTDPTRNIKSSNVYRCKSVLAAELNPKMDFAIIKLDRRVLGREPLTFRTEGKIPTSTSLVVIGHPNGIPTKVADGGKVTLNSNRTTFSTNLDTFQGNSGSAVLNSQTGQIEGILTQGKNDYVPSVEGDPLSCFVVNECLDNGLGCKGGPEFGAIQRGEVVLRITTIADKLTKIIASGK